MVRRPRGDPVEGRLRATTRGLPTPAKGDLGEAIYGVCVMRLLVAGVTCGFAFKYASSTSA